MKIQPLMSLVVSVLLLVMPALAEPKALVLPDGFAFGDVYDGPCEVCGTNRVYGFGGTPCYEAHVKRPWMGFPEYRLTLSKYKRIKCISVCFETTNQTEYASVTNRYAALKKKLTEEFGWEINRRSSGVLQPNANQDFSWVRGIKGESCHLNYAIGYGRKPSEGRSRAHLRATFFSDASQRLEQPERAKAGACVRDMVKRVFNVEIGGAYPKTEGAFRWQKLDAPILGLTERRIYMGPDGFGVSSAPKIGNVSFRRVFEGDVSAAELATATSNVVLLIEKELGQKLDAHPFGARAAEKRTLPTTDDINQWPFRNEHPIAQKQFGDMQITVQSYEPLYMKEGLAYRQVTRGLIVVHIIRFNH